MRALTQLTRREITQLFERVKRIGGNQALTLLAAKAPTATGRLLLVTSRKVGNAPERNKVRRQLKHLFYEKHWYMLGYDFIIIVHKKGVVCSYDTFSSSLERYIKRLH